MKKRFLTTLFVLFGTICFGQNYAIKSEGVESVVADYAKEIIDKNIIVKTGYEYELVLSQNGDSFSVSYVVNPGNMAGQESTDDLWNEIEQTITRALNAMNKQIDNAIMAQKQAEKQKEQEMIDKEKENSVDNADKVEVKQNDVIKDKQEVTGVADKESDDNFLKKQYEQHKSNIEEKQENKQIDKMNQNNFYNGMKVYSMNEVKSGMASVGSLIQFPDGSKGVVYYLDGNGQGLAVSLEQTRLKWENVDDEEHCIDLPSLKNMSKFDRQCVLGQGEIETAMIVEYQGYPAANWCVSRGNGWYLPSVGELYQLLVVANGENGKNGFISIILMTCGGDPLDGNWYWSSTEENAENVYNISSSGRIATEIKCEKVYTRAIRRF